MLSSLCNLLAAARGVRSPILVQLLIQSVDVCVEHVCDALLQSSSCKRSPNLDMGLIVTELKLQEFLQEYVRWGMYGDSVYAPFQDNLYSWQLRPIFVTTNLAFSCRTSYFRGLSWSNLIRCLWRPQREWWVEMRKLIFVRHSTLLALCFAGENITATSLAGKECERREERNLPEWHTLASKQTVVVFDSGKKLGETTTQYVSRTNVSRLFSIHQLQECSVGKLED